MISSAVKLLALLNQEQGSALTESDIGFGLPSLYTGADKRSDNEVVVSITSPKYRGDASVRYFRMELGILFNGLTVSFPFGGNTALSQLVPLLNRYYGTDFDADMFDDVTASNGQVVLSAKATDYYISGSITVADGDLPSVIPLISELITQQQFDGFLYFDQYGQPAEGLTFMQALTYPIDFSDISDSLAYRDSTDIDEFFSDVLYEAMGIPWDYVDELSPYNLKDATVSYNGKVAYVDGRLPAVNADYTHVMALAVDETKCSNLVGAGVLHYNLPEEKLWLKTNVIVTTTYDAITTVLAPNRALNNGNIEKINLYKRFSYGGYQCDLLLWVRFFNGNYLANIANYAQYIQVGDVIYEKKVINNASTSNTYVGYAAISGNHDDNFVENTKFTFSVYGGVVKLATTETPEKTVLTFDFVPDTTWTNAYVISGGGSRVIGVASESLNNGAWQLDGTQWGFCFNPPDQVIAGKYCITILIRAVSNNSVISWQQAPAAFVVDGLTYFKTSTVINSRVAYIPEDDELAAKVYGAGSHTFYVLDNRIAPV